MPAITLRAEPAVVATTAAVAPSAERSYSLDAFRGLIMLLLVSGSFGFRSLKDHPSFAWIAAQFDHVPWEGAVFYDLIQPAFMFMVGTALPFVIVARRQVDSGLVRHAAVRSLRLVLLSQILMCIAQNRLHFQLINVLSQMAFTYLLCFIILQWPRRAQAAAAGALLVFHTALFYLFPGPEGPFSREGNVGQVIDLWLLGYNYGGRYVTINFIPSVVTTLFGAWCGMLLMAKGPARRTSTTLAVAALACFAAGLALSPWVPLVKRIWTASFTLYSAGWVFLMMLGVYAVTEIAGWRAIAFPAVVMGMNSIFIYSVDQVLRGWIDRAVAVFTGKFVFIGTMAPVAQATAVLLVMWALCYWLYKRKIFLKL